MKKDKNIQQTFIDNIAQLRAILLAEDYYYRIAAIQSAIQAYQPNTHENVYYSQFVQRLIELQKDKNNIVCFRSYFLQEKYSSCLDISEHMLTKAQCLALQTEISIIKMHYFSYINDDPSALSYLSAIKLLHQKAFYSKNQLAIETFNKLLQEETLIWILRDKLLSPHLSSKIKYIAKECLIAIGNYSITEDHPNKHASLVLRVLADADPTKEHYQEAALKGDSFSASMVMRKECEEIKYKIELLRKAKTTFFWGENERLQELTKHAITYYKKLIQLIDVIFELIIFKTPDREEAENFVETCAANGFDQIYSSLSHLPIAIDLRKMNEFLTAKALMLQAAIKNRPDLCRKAKEISRPGMVEAQELIEKYSNNNHIALSKEVRNEINRQEFNLSNEVQRKLGRL